MRIGVDLGGTKIEAAALAADGAIVARERVATPQGDYVATIAAIATLVTKLEQQTGLSGSVGVGIPGAERQDGLIKNANSTCLIGKPLRADLASALGQPVRLANDANCFALSEAVDGAGAGTDMVFGVILGTGVGGGLVLHKRVWEGANRIAGEWGHNPLTLDSDDSAANLPIPACYCGRSGCVETWLSGPGLSLDLQRHGGPPLTALQIANAAASGDAACEAALQRYERRLAKALGVVINILDPDVIVLGGGLSQLDRLYTNVPRYWLPHVFTSAPGTRLLPPRHGDASGVRGAAWLW